jgi:hypothetical protein
MVELPLLIIIVILIVLAMRRGKRVVLESPVIIQRSGQYHITLAPQLGGAQTFIEKIAGQFSQSLPPDGHGRNATADDEASHARNPRYALPLPNPDGTTSQSTKPASGQVAGYLPQAGRAERGGRSRANELLREFSVQGDLPTQYFEVSDPGVFSQSGSSYLLAIALRGGVLYFQAINPQPLLNDADSHYKTLRKFSESVLQHHPVLEPADQQWAEKLRLAVDAIAAQLQIVVKTLPQPD